MGNVPRNAQLFGEDVCSARRQQRHGNLAAREPVDDLVDRAVAAAGDHHAAALVNRLSRDLACGAGSSSGRELRGDACILQNARRVLDFREAALAFAPAGGVVDQQRVFDFVRHRLVPWDSGQARIV